MTTIYNKYIKPRFSRNLSSPFFSVEDLRVRIGWFINLRWLAIIGILVAVPVSSSILHFNLAYYELILIVVLMIILNIFYFLLWRHLPTKDEFREMTFAESQIITDLFILSLIIHFSGGIQNPFLFLFLVHIILSGIIFPGAVLPYINAIIASVFLSFWSISEYVGVFKHFSLEGNLVSFSYLFTVLASFYIITFSVIYIINSFMIRYQSLKKMMDDKTSQLESEIVERNKAFRYAAHELKSPMVAIKSTLDVILSLYSNDMKPEIKNMVLRADRRSDQIINMVKELISITQYNLGIEKPEFITVEYDDWLTQLVLTHVDNALQKNIVLSIVHDNDNFLIDIDKAGLESVANNLISNAIRYTPCGGKVFLIAYRRKNCYGFSVKDTGIGISDEDKDKIFTEFYRSKKAKEMEQIGTGLGLNLVKEIVNRNKGNIRVESEEGKGSTFTVEFPLSESESSGYEYHLITKPYLFE